MEDWIAECAVYMLQTAIPTYDPAKCQKFELFLYFWLSRRLTDRIHSRQHREDKRSRQLVEVEYIAASTLEVEELEAKLRLLLGDEYIDGRLNGTIRRDGSRYGEKHYTGNTSYAVNRKLRNVRERLK